MSVKDEVVSRLNELGIPFELAEHEPIYTMEECAHCSRQMAGVIPKNLFLRPRRAEKYYLLILRGDVPYNASLVSHQADSPRLGFADEEALFRLLHTRPGSISPLGLMFDTQNEVTLLVDEALAREERLLFHPCDNRFTVGLSGEDFFQRFLPACGHAPRFVRTNDLE